MVVLVTHTDLDGVACAVLVSSVEDVTEIRFTQPALVQKKLAEIPKGSIITDLPWHHNAAKWFDHHASVHPPAKFEGSFVPNALSCARVIYDYYDNPFLEKFLELVEQTDLIDSAQISQVQVENPSGYYLLSLSLDDAPTAAESFAYRRLVIELLKKKSISGVLGDERVKKACEHKLSVLKKAEQELPAFTRKQGAIVVVDLRAAPKWLENAGGRWSVYINNKDCVASIRLKKSSQEGHVDISVGKNVFCKKEFSCDIGELMKKIGGGGHGGAGGASVPAEKADEIVAMLLKEMNGTS